MTNGRERRGGGGEECYEAEISVTTLPSTRRQDAFVEMRDCLSAMDAKSLRLRDDISRAGISE